MGAPLVSQRGFCLIGWGRGWHLPEDEAGRRKGDCPYELADHKLQWERASPGDPYRAVVPGGPCGTSIPSVSETTVATGLRLPHRDLSLECLHGLTKVTTSLIDQAHMPGSPDLKPQAPCTYNHLLLKHVKPLLHLTDSFTQWS